MCNKVERKWELMKETCWRGKGSHFGPQIEVGEEHQTSVLKQLAFLAFFPGPNNVATLSMQHGRRLLKPSETPNMLTVFSYTILTPP